MRRTLTQSILLTICVAFSVLAVAQEATCHDRRLQRWETTRPMVTSDRLPVPAGPYSIGTSVFHLTDLSRKDQFATEPGRFREFVVQLWFPAAENQGSNSTIPYLLSPGVDADLKSGKYPFLTAAEADELATIRTHSHLDAGLVMKPTKLPLLLFSHGYGVPRSLYTSLMEDMASHGYIVAFIDHPYDGLTQLPDGRMLRLQITPPLKPEVAAGIIGEMARDQSFVLDRLLNGRGTFDRFADRIDKNRIGALGHSIGGAAALESCRTNALMRACADLDGNISGNVETEGVHQPHLVIIGEPSHMPADARKRREELFSTILARRKTSAFLVVINGTYHYTFSDVPFLTSVDNLNKRGAILAPARAFKIISSTLDTFFSESFGMQTEPSLNVGLPQYPEVSVLRF